MEWEIWVATIAAISTLIVALFGPGALRRGYPLFRSLLGKISNRVKRRMALMVADGVILYMKDEFEQINKKIDDSADVSSKDRKTIQKTLNDVHTGMDSMHKELSDVKVKVAEQGGILQEHVRAFREH